MKQSEILFGLLRIPMDAMAVFCALILSYRLREAQIDLIPNVQLLEPATTLPTISEFISFFVVPGMLVFICIAAVLRLYGLRTTLSAWSEIGTIFLSAMVWLVAVISWYFFIQKQLFYSRVLLVHSTVLIFLIVSFARLAITMLQRASLEWGVGVRAVASVGRHSIAPLVEEYLHRDIRYKYLGHCKTLSFLKKMQSRTPVDVVLHTDPDRKSDDTLLLIDYCRSQHVGYSFLPPVFSDAPHQLVVDHLGLTPVISFQPTPLDGWGRVWKRGFDILCSSMGLIVLSPVFLLIALAIYLDDRGPVLYNSKRVGLLGKGTVNVWKFRSMVQDADRRKQELLQNNERTDGPLFKIKDDPRITRIGALLRRFDLDELPQLWNVLTGDMSLVGPRPHLPEEVAKYSDYQRRVFAVVPGITGLAQVSGRSNLKFEDEVRYDLQYIEEWSLWFDVWILWRTVMVVLGKGEQQ